MNIITKKYMCKMFDTENNVCGLLIERFKFGNKGCPINDWRLQIRVAIIPSTPCYKGCIMIDWSQYIIHKEILATHFCEVSN